MNTAPVRSKRADVLSHGLTDTQISLIKGMLRRGDRQSDIAAFFATNGGRVAEINKGQRGDSVTAAPKSKLPPPGPYLSPLATYQVKQALLDAKEAIDAALRMIDK